MAVTRESIGSADRGDGVVGGPAGRESDAAAVQPGFAPLGLPDGDPDSLRPVRTVLCWVVAGVFLYAGVIKIANPFEFAQSIKYYKLLPLELVNLLALLLPWWEVAAAVALVVPSWRKAGGLMITGMLLMFLGAVSTAVYRGLDISCGCFGTRSSKAGLQTLAIDVALLLAMWLIFCYRRPSPRST